ncbi:MAG: ABC transporter ATP-binding protein [Acidobacteria bacterium]|nr:MAG: ABC transporter ATP-binding protein [Acidobacteriota bacterium]
MNERSEAVVIRTRDLTRRFGSLAAVDHLNLDVVRGEIFGLVGPDGAGKTTTLRLLCGLLRPSEGRAWVAGYDVAREAEKVRDRIGYMAERFGLYDDLTVEENMTFYADVFGLPVAQRGPLMSQLLHMTRMEPFRQRLARHLSGGMKQKLALMCALLHHPEILFLDEPTTGVDPVSRRDFWAILYGLVRRGLTVLITTAYLDEAERCHRVGFLYRGRLLHCDTPERLKTGLEETCYELLTPRRRAVREVLVGLNGIVGAELSGAALHVFLSPTGPSIQEVVRILERKGLGPVRVRPIVPSMEDVFILFARKAHGRGEEGRP